MSHNLSFSILIVLMYENGNKMTYNILIMEMVNNVNPNYIYIYI